MTKQMILFKLSLEAPLVACIWTAFICGYNDVQPPFIFYWLLGSSVWCVYVLDRIFEGDPSLIEKRHLFYKNHYRKFLAGVALILTTSGILFFGFAYQSTLLRFGLVAIAGTGTYLVISFFWIKPSQLKEWIKNTITSLLFTLGVWTPVLLVKEENTALLSAPLYALFFLVMHNLRLIESIPKTSRKTSIELVILLFIQFLCYLAQPNLITGTWLVSALLMQCIYLTQRNRSNALQYDICLMLPPLISMLL